MRRFDLTVLGCGDAFGSGGRFQTSFLVDLGEMRLLLDCGATTLVALSRAGIEPAGIDLILISHLHGDHFGGLPFLLLEQHFRARRERPLTIVGPAGTAPRLRAAREVLFPGSGRLALRFPLHVEAFVPGTAWTRGALTIAAHEVEHPSGAPSLGLRLQAHGRTLAYSGDTQWTESLVALSDQADLLICECYAHAPGISNHMSYETLMANRARLRAKRILLTHLAEDMLKRRSGLALEVLEDGMKISL
jgi:ribonuclease BN (tRNA processing enzyme)